MRLWLPVSQVSLAIILLMIGSKQVTTFVQDSTPFVAPATKLCESINVPAALAVAGLAILADSFHFGWSLSWAPIPQILLLGGVTLLWFIVGLEIERLTRKPSITRRLIAACIAFTLAAGFALIGITAWHMGEVALSMGCAVWSVVLTLFYGVDTIRLMVPDPHSASPLKGR